MKYAPIILFTYNRLSHTQKTVAALLENSLARQSDLFIYSDAPKKESDVEKVEALRAWIKKITDFQSITIIYRAHNFGLAASIIDGVTNIVGQFGRVIVVEDDLVVSKHFLTFMNESLDLYENNEQICAITGYHPPCKANLPETYFLRGGDCCWGWATWARAWRLFEPNGTLLLDKLKKAKAFYNFNYQGTQPNIQMLRDQIQGKNNSWAIRWHASAFLHNKFTLYPARSLVHNIGNDNTGEHSIATDVFDVTLSTLPITVTRQVVSENVQALKAYVQFFKTHRVPLHKRIRNFVKRKFQMACRKYHSEKVCLTVNAEK